MIDKNNPNTWGKLFDTVIDLLEQGKLVEGVDHFDMAPILDHRSCGTVACLFGSAAMLAGITEDDNARTLFKLWNPFDERMQSIHNLCCEIGFEPDQVIDHYREFCQ